MALLASHAYGFLAGFIGLVTMLIPALEEQSSAAPLKITKMTRW